MAAKANIQDLKDLGFEQSQFRYEGDDTGWNTFLASVLADVEQITREQVGSAAYDAIVDGARLVYLKNAEKEFCAADLWRRVESFERGTAQVNGAGTGAETIGSRPLENANKAEERAWDYLARVTGTNAMQSFGHVQSGALEEEATTS
ncbi:MAG: hypothetical protein HUJ30_02395 [Gammaproteobacteria bacterium]|nr:hypothetical protein [Gammaproteobacteria bacterium]